ncbi:hypothetical protein [Denitrobacterium detoxificans]|nr:hypothetical protein [Denitrobacterium detoxificans]
MSGPFCLLVRNGERENILQKRFKKHAQAYGELFRIVQYLSSLDYESCIAVGFDGRYFDTIRADGDLSLIEIRVRNTLWRVIAYWVRDRRMIVVLDAFEAHKHKSMFEMVKVVTPKLLIVDELLERGLM